ncbi:MAG: hypothetical protein ACRDIC_24335 [bacterium]
MDAHPNLLVDIDADLLRHLKCRSKRVWNRILESTCMGSATDVDLEAIVVHKHGCTVSFKNLVLDRASLSSLPVSLAPLHLQWV